MIRTRLIYNAIVLAWLLGHLIAVPKFNLWCIRVSTVGSLHISSIDSHIRTVITVHVSNDAGVSILKIRFPVQPYSGVISIGFGIKLWLFGSAWANTLLSTLRAPLFSYRRLTCSVPWTYCQLALAWWGGDDDNLLMKLSAEIEFRSMCQHNPLVLECNYDGHN